MSLSHKTPTISLLLSLLFVVNGACGPEPADQPDGSVDPDATVVPDGMVNPDSTVNPDATTQADAFVVYDCTDNADCVQHEDGNLCNGTLVCVDHGCQIDAATVVHCDAPADPQCQTNDCNPSTGTCTLSTANDGTPCGSGGGCTTNGTCASGTCVGGSETCCTDGQDNDGDGQTDCDDADCAGLPDCTNGCTAVPVPVVASHSPLTAQAPNAQTESVYAGGFNDRYVYNLAGTLKIGIREEWGGSIIFFGESNGSPGMNTTNVIDAGDTGREVQAAFYDADRHMQNCAWNASCQTTPTQCAQEIQFLGWNPVQGGNRCNMGSGFESIDMGDGAITVDTIPQFWNPNWDWQTCVPTDCNDPSANTRQSDVRIIQRVRFVRDNVVELEYTVINLANMDHAAMPQEMPTVYTSNGQYGPDLWRLFGSNSVEIPIDTPGPENFFYENFTSSGGWVALQNDSLDYGVGLSMENRLTNWQAWQLRSLPFNNFRPSFTFGIPPYGTIRARSYLILGSLGTVASEAQWLDANLPPFGSLDVPAEEETVSGQIAIQGWAQDNKVVTSVELLVDGVSTGTLSYGINRPDVCAVWPAYPVCSQVGYSGTLDTTGLSACPHLLEVRAHDADGNSRIIDRHRIFVAP